jgi:2-polyprenyl-6-methoxyphenol hydroxylase-like FAD-dependent oxidoreductase
MACVSNGLIVGGGIAGLSAAIALGRAGVHCDVVEMADAPLGASLALSGRATDALAELGVYDECYKTGRPFTPDSTAASQNDATGRMLSAGPTRPQWPGAKTPVGVYRPVFVQILTDAALRLGAKIQKGLTIETIEDRDNASFVVLDNGEERRYDFVIGADGIGSRTRALVFPDAPEPAYAGQMSIRWVIPGPAIAGEGWYIAPLGRLGFYALPHQGIVYVPLVISMPEQKLTQAEIYSLVKNLLDSYTAPAVVELRRHLTPSSDLIFRPFKWILVPPPWHRGRTLLIGDAAHATTAHMGMGGGMALEDAVVLAQCIAAAPTLADAYDAFMSRRLERVRTVVETSVTMSRIEQAGTSRLENVALMSSALAAIAQPY